MTCARSPARRPGRQARQQPAVHPRPGLVAGHGDVRRATAATTSSSRSTGGADPAGLRPRRRGTRTTSSPGPVTHNSIYGFRGADIRNILEFEDTTSTRTSSGWSRTTARRRRSSSAANAVVAQQPRAQDQVAVDGDRRGRPDQGARARRRARRGALRRRGDRAAGRRGRVARGARRLLPHQRAVAGAGGHARARADRLPGDRRHEVLRARRDQGRGRLPHVPGQPRRTAARSRGSRTRRSAGSARRRCRGCSRMPRRWGSPLGGRRRPRGRCRARHRRAARARALHVDDGAAGRARRTARRSPRCSRRRCARPATSTRWRPSARSRRRAGSRTWRSSSGSRASTTPRAGEDARRGGVPAADRADLRRRRDPRRRGAGDADDAPQRQGARVPDRVHHRLRGRRVPAQPGARRGRGWRRSGGWPTSASRAPCATSTSPTRGAATRSALRLRVRPCARASSTRSRAS